MPSQMQAEASVKKPDFVCSKDSNIFSPVTTATIVAMIAAKRINFHTFSLMEIREILPK